MLTRVGSGWYTSGAALSKSITNSDFVNCRNTDAAVRCFRRRGFVIEYRYSGRVGERPRLSSLHRIHSLRTHVTPSNTTLFRAARILFGVVASVFGGIGLLVILFLWGTPPNEFGAPPLFFRVFGSLIAVAFIAFSAFGIYGAITLRLGPFHSKLRSGRGAAGSYSCPSCGAGLGADTEVSPSGDVKCTHCGNWFNVRGEP